MRVAGASLPLKRLRFMIGLGVTVLFGCSSLPASDVAQEATPTSVTTTETTSTVAPTTTTAAPTTTLPVEPSVSTGADRLVANGFREVAGQRVGLIANHTAVVGDAHLIDLMASNEAVSLTALFAPEHGARGQGDAGEAQQDGLDEQTGVPIYSLYGDTKQPSQAMLNDVDVLVYDMQDVGCRFYTFISTLGLAMQAAAEAGIPFVVLDRPNPNPGPSAGFVLEPSQRSFIGQYEIPATYGLTVGELALAIKGEGWLSGLDQLDLTVIPLEGWDHSMFWDDRPWLAPSPGLPSIASARLYPGTVLFEATNLSWGRGTDAPFEQFGAPWLDAQELSARLNSLADITPELTGVDFLATTFTPARLDYMTADPQFVGEEVPAVRMIVSDPGEIEPVALGVYVIAELLAMHSQAAIERPETFDLLVGTADLRSGLEQGTSASDLVASWSAATVAFDLQMMPYRLYP